MRDFMEHLGILKLTNTLFTMCTPQLIEQIHEFVMQGKHIHVCKDAEKDCVTYITYHPDFTEKDGTEYMLIVTRNTQGKEYLHALQAFTPEGLVTVRKYESPYANKN
jgi:hypothetical protein